MIYIPLRRPVEREDSLSRCSGASSHLSRVSSARENYLLGATAPPASRCGLDPILKAALAKPRFGRRGEPAPRSTHEPAYTPTAARAHGADAAAAAQWLG